jgi:PadR family transcriptional regulator, regulatory protein PadR
MFAGPARAEARWHSSHSIDRVEKSANLRLYDGQHHCDVCCTVVGVQCMTHRMADPEIFDNLRLELRRGCLTLAVLTQLHTERYGYTLRKALADDGLEIDEGTLYPLLRRLESQGLLVSKWREEDKRNKRFYNLSRSGQDILRQLLAAWQRINTSLNKILQEA